MSQGIKFTTQERKLLRSVLGKAEAFFKIKAAKPFDFFKRAPALKRRASMCLELRKKFKETQ